MKYTFTIKPANKAAFTRTSDDSNYEEAMETFTMMQECFPDCEISMQNKSLSGL